MESKYVISKDKNTMIRNSIITVLMITINCYFGYYIVKYENSNINIFFLLFLIISIHFIVTAFHELGHIIISKLKNYELRFVIIGCTIISKIGDKYSFRFLLSNFIFGGVTVLNLNKQIISYDEYLKFKKDFYAISIGGVLSNLIIGILVLFMILLGNNTNFVLFVLQLFFILNINCIILSFYSMGDIDRIITIYKDSGKLQLYLFEEIRFKGDVNPFIKGMTLEYLQRILQNKHIALYDIDIMCNVINSDAFNCEDVDGICEFCQWVVNHYKDIVKYNPLSVKIKIKQLTWLLINKKKFEIDNISCDIKEESIPININLFNDK